jgi:sugar lactone lactonase YvrE
VALGPSAIATDRPSGEKIANIKVCAIGLITALECAGELNPNALLEVGDDRARPWLQPPCVAGIVVLRSVDQARRHGQSERFQAVPRFGATLCRFPACLEPVMRIAKIVLRLLIAVALLLLCFLGWLKWQHGGGSPYPDISTAPLLPTNALEVLVEMDYPPGNVAVSPDGRVFINVHPFAQAQRFGVPTLMELVEGRLLPYPSAEAQRALQGVFGMTVDAQQRLWLIEPAGLDHEQTRLSAIDLGRNQHVFEHRFSAGVAQFAQDLRVSPDGDTVVLADTGLFKFTAPELLVVDVASKRVVTRLATHASLQPQDWVMRTPLGPHRLGFGLVTFAVGIDGIEISSDGQWLIYAAMTHDTAFRVPLAALVDPAIDDAALAPRIERVGRKPMSDGITFDTQGRLILTDIENGGLMRLEADGTVRTLVRDSRIIWADGVARAPDGALLFTDSAIPAYIDQLARPPTPERLAAGRPYRVWRVRQ